MESNSQFPIPNSSKELFNYTLQLADNALIIGHRISEWCGHGPILEQDIALTNTSLDHLGRARSLFQYAAVQFNNLPASEKSQVVSSIALQNLVSTRVILQEDHLAYLRDGWDFKNLLLLEQPNIDWAYTVARSFFYDAFNFLLFNALVKSKDDTLAAVAEKSLKEVTYHLRWSSEWVIRLGDGTEESHSRMQKAVDELWMYTGELFNADEVEIIMADQGIGVDPSTLKDAWMKTVTSIFEEACINMPTEAWMQYGGKEGRHTEYLGYILAEFQFLQRTYPGMEW
jgi:ring-1,2-phenylacetyl-CoA epoxidase subunit PaaC